MNISRLVKCSLFIFVALIMLSACGGNDNAQAGGENNTVNSGKSSEIKTGQFLDSPVKGLGYSTGSQTGTTGDQGEFRYKEGESVTFSIGNISLGNTVAKPVVTPLDLVAGAIDYKDPAVINMLRLLQTLDQDGDSNLSIEIDPATIKAATTDIRFDVTESDFSNDPIILALIGTVRGQTQLVETKDAIQHFQATLGKVNGNANENSSSHSVGGQLFGLTGTLVIQNNAETLSLTANGAFTFNSPVSNGAGYSVVITQQPENQVCQVDNGSGLNVTANVTSVLITCFASSFTIGGTVSGLTGSLEIKNNGSDNVILTENGRFTFPARVARGGYYVVEIVTPPEGQVCSIVNGRGEFVYTDITNISITCDIKSFSIGGTVEGLAAGNTLELLNNDTDKKTITANGVFVFDSPVVKDYLVTVMSQPRGQTCDITDGSGKNISTDISSIIVICSDNPFTIGGNVTGLKGTLVLQADGEDDLTITKDGPFTFAPRVVAGTNYNVTVKSQPTTPVEQLCTVDKGVGNNITASVTNIAVACEDRILITEIVGGFIECTPDLPRITNGDGDSVCNTGAFATCVTDNATEKGWTYMDEVTSLDCNQAKKGVTTQSQLFSIPGVDDIRDVAKFTKLKSLDLGFNRLEQVVSSDLTTLAGMSLSYLNLAKNARFPSLEIGLTTSFTTSLTITEEEALNILDQKIIVSEISENTPRILGKGVDIITSYAIGGFPCDFDNGYTYCISGGMWGYKMALELHELIDNQLCGFTQNSTLSSIYKFTNNLDEVSNPYGLVMSCVDPVAYTVAQQLNDRRYVHSSSILNNNIYVTGGIDPLAGGGAVSTSRLLASAEVFDPAFNSWVSIAPMMNARAGHSSVVRDGKLYVLGGSANSGLLSSMEIYDPVVNEWSSGASFSIPRTAHTSVILNGKIYVIGGINSAGEISSVEVYDPSINSWSNAAPLPTPRHYHRSDVVNGKIYVTGGYGSTGYLSSVEVYDPVTNTWSTVASLNNPRGQHSSVVLNGKLYALGGVNGTGTLSSSEVYNDSTDQWIQLADEVILKDSFHSTVSVNGKIYKTGGRNWSKETFIYNPLLDPKNPFSLPGLFSNAPNSVIPDNASDILESTINVSGTRTIVTPTFSIDVEINHSAAEELTIDLISPKGTSVRLWSPGGVSTTNIIGNFPSTLSVSGDLSVLNSEAMDGVWTLRIYDGGTAGRGSLVSWGIKP